MADINIDRLEILRAAVTSPQYDTYARERARAIQAVANDVFMTRQVHDNEGRTSETTPPKYVGSWEIRREGNTIILVNTDRSAVWVEFGAHAGGRTPVLKYRPLGTALSIIEGQEGAG